MEKIEFKENETVGVISEHENKQANVIPCSMDMHGTFEMHKRRTFNVGETVCVVPKDGSYPFVGTITSRDNTKVMVRPVNHQGRYAKGVEFVHCDEEVHNKDWFEDKMHVYFKKKGRDEILTGVMKRHEDTCFAIIQTDDQYVLYSDCDIIDTMDPGFRDKRSYAKLGLKNDFADGKLRYDLFPLEEMDEVVKLFTFGCKKYKENSWKDVENGEARYRGAMLRHLTQHLRGEEKDNESDCSHLSAVVWNSIAMYFHWKKNKK